MSSVKWSAKGTKDTISAADQFLMLDSDDIINSTKNKLVTFETLSNDSAWKKPVRAATVVAGVLADDFAAGDTIDNVLLAEDDRILLKDQDVVDEITLDTVGVGFTSVPEVVFDNTDTGGTGATATVEVSGGNTLENLTLTSGGKGYTTAPTISFVGGSPSTPATASATISTDENGGYVVQSSGAPVRATDMDLSTEFPAATIRVIEGEINGNTVWSTQTNNEMWFPASGLGTFNTKHIYSEDDFLPTIAIPSFGDLHPLENNIEYVIAAPLNLTNGLFMDAGFDIRMRGFSDHTNRIFTDKSGVSMLVSRDKTIAYTSVTDEGSGEIKFLTTQTLDLSVGTRLNIISDTGVDYTQIAAEITAIDTGTSVTVKSSVPFSGTVSEGFYDLGAKSLELENVVFQNPAANAIMFSMGFTGATASEFYARHCQIQGFLIIGFIDKARSAIFLENEFEEADSKIDFEDCIYALISENTWTDTNPSTTDPLLEIGGTDTQTYIITNNQFLSRDSDFAIKVGAAGGGDIGTGRVIVESNVDLKIGSTTLFDPTGFDETSPNLIVKNNPNQKDSKVTGQIVIPGTDPDNTFAMLVIAKDIPEDFVSAGFVTTNLERISVDTNDGTMEYLGFEDTVLKFDYRGSFSSSGGGVDHYLTLSENANYKNGDPVTLRGQASGADNATATITVDGNGLITAVTGIGGTNTGYTAGEKIIITETGSGVTRGNGTGIGSGSLTGVTIDDGEGFLEIPNVRNYITVNNATLRYLGTTVEVSMSTGDKVRPQFGNFDNVADMNGVVVRLVVSEV